ncbi:hypothetical protein Nepgr_001137 [Nepenthes gracilis]|uniref:Tudor domain-containing protein n=1 Tax=Nepenthes gracilis TaxID=150966 RepID=A0AAD3RXC1_NEPGR|nr:hypothetical protein Nepgr_001137 [Nepenthes gracilis]
MAEPVKELEEQLMEAGNKLLSPPSSVDKLLSLLDQIEIYLARVEQSPSESMQKALSPSMRALVADELLKHSDLDVKVSVAACISEITRITAPEAPYDDNQMKEVFQLIVSSFERLYDKSSRSYNKRASILETVAKVRSCVVMLDLECDALILEMFQHFLKSIRGYHPDSVFTSMETIMTLVLEESEDIPLALIISILACLKRDNKEVLVAQKLGEKVLANCATKLKPYLLPAMKSLNSSLDDYTKVVANICQGTSVVEPNDGNASTMNLATKETLAEDATPDVPPGSATSPKSFMSNGTVQKGIDDSSVSKDSTKEPERDDHVKSKIVVELSKTKTMDCEKSVSMVKAQSKPEKAIKRGGRKSNDLKSPSDPAESLMEDQKEAEIMSDHHEYDTKNVGSSPCQNPAAGTTVSSENEKETIVPLPVPKTSGNEAIDVASPSPSRTVYDENQTRKTGRRKKKDNLTKKATLSVNPDIRKVSEGSSVSGSKSHKRAGKKVQADDESTPGPADVSKKADGIASDLDTKSINQIFEKVEAVNNKLKNMKRRVKGKSVSGNDLAKTSSKNDSKKSVSAPTSAAKPIKDESQLEKTPKVKRKRTQGKVFDTKEYGEDLVGAKVKVWWPEDEQFYDGVVDAFDPVNKKHKVTYHDGDVEMLLLKDETWELIEHEPVSHMENSSGDESPGASIQLHEKKKAKLTPASSRKLGKTDRKGGASPSKVTATFSKSVQKQKKDDGKSKDKASKNLVKSEDEKDGKSRDLKGSNRAGASVKLAGKSKDEHTQTPKANNKSKPVTPKKAVRSKGKTSKSGSKSNANGSGKVKSGSSKTDATEDVKTPESAKAPESGKVKASSSKPHKSETKTGKKRPRGD